MLIESWGESTNELCYLPVYEETYKVKFLTEAPMVVAMFERKSFSLNQKRVTTKSHQHET